MRRNIVLKSAVALALALGTPGLVWADLIVNGSFEITSPMPSLGSTQISDNPNGPDSSHPSYITVTGWARGGPNTWVQTATGNTIMEGPNTGVMNGLGASPDGGNYLAVDGASSFLSSVSQTVTGLTPGVTYRLQFYDGAGQQTAVPAATLSDQFVVAFGSQMQDGPVYTTSDFGFSGWHLVTMDFVATSASQVLTFSAMGSPNLPPYMVLDGVTMSSVPEPSSLAMMVLGGLAFGGLYVRRRVRLRAAA
jgi:hypothetical protein